MRRIYYGGSILTMKEKDDYVEALMVEDGIIRQTGSLEELQKSAGNAKMICLEGKTLMPSFIDAHSHVMGASQYLWAADLGECKNFMEIIQKLKRYIQDKNITADDFVYGFNYDHEFLEEKTHPNKLVLNQVSKEIPIYISHISGHMGCANDAALKEGNITAESKPTHLIGRVKGSLEPDGYLEEGDAIQLLKKLYPRIKRNLVQDLQFVQKLYASYGITTVQEGAATQDSILFLRTMAQRKMLTLDIVAYLLMEEDTNNVINGNQEYDRKYFHHFKIGGYKIILDGSPQGKSAWMSAPYENSHGFCGHPWHSNQQVEKYIQQAVQEKKQVLAHCNGDAASEQFIETYEKVIKQEKDFEKFRLRPVMIHSQTVRDDQLDRMKKIGMLPSFFIGHIWFWGDIHLKNLGKKRGKRISPVKSAIDRKIRYTFHQDTPVTKPDMLHSIWCAVNRISRQGVSIGSDQKIGVYEALEGITRYAAYQNFEEDKKGSLEAGKIADMVILDKNPLEIEPMKIKDVQVVETIKDGKTIYKKSTIKEKK